MNERAWKAHSFSGTCLVLAAVLATPVQSSDGMKADPVPEPAPAAPADAPAGEAVERRPLKKAKRLASRTLAAAIRPLLSYPRNHLVKLLPSKKHLPAHLADKDHNDYLPPFQWIPRGWTTFNWGRPALIVGNQKSHQDGAPKPIGERGSLQVSTYPELPAPLCWVPLYFAFTLPNGLHFRLGARWDDVDAYVVLPSVALKRNVE